jgi:hypothetical protein
MLPTGYHWNAVVEKPSGPISIVSARGRFEGFIRSRPGVRSDGTETGETQQPLSLILGDWASSEVRLER